MVDCMLPENRLVH